jgi:hypothetical protein
MNVKGVSQTLHTTNFCVQTYLLTYTGSINSCRTVKKIIRETLKLEKALSEKSLDSNDLNRQLRSHTDEYASQKLVNAESYIHIEDRMANSCSVSMRTSKWTKKKYVFKCWIHPQ